MKVNQRLDALTSLRFIAAAMIVIIHIEDWDGLFGFYKNNPPFLAWAQGVSFFFVLSGFILAYIYPKMENWPEVRRFLRARIARIWPALFASFILAIWLLSLEWDYKTGFANLFMVNAWIPFPIYFFSYNSPSWSISTEFFFYLAFPLLIYQWNKTWLVKLLVSGAIVVALISVSNMLKLPGLVSIDDKGVTLSALLRIHPASRIFEFVFGMCVATYWRKQVGFVQWSESRATLYEAGAILLAGAFMYFTVPLSKWIGKTWAGSAASAWLGSSGSMLAFGLLIYVMAMGRGRIAAWLSHPMPVLLGEISFSLYLLHQILLRYYQANIAAFPVLPNMLLLAIFWVVLLLASYVMWSLIEMPCRRLILGRGQKNIHGTKIMQESWHSHLNLNRKTLSAAVVLTCLVTSIYFSLGEPMDRMSPSDADAMTNKEMQSAVGTQFGNIFKLRGVKVVRIQEGLNIEIAWESLVDQELTLTNSVHLTDELGNHISGGDYRQPMSRKTEKQGTIWRDLVFIPAEDLTGWESKLAIALFKKGGKFLPVDRGNRDWKGHRLLIDLGDAIH